MGENSLLIKEELGCLWDEISDPFHPICYSLGISSIRISSSSKFEISSVIPFLGLTRDESSSMSIVEITFPTFLCDFSESSSSSSIKISPVLEVRLPESYSRLYREFSTLRVDLYFSEYFKELYLFIMNDLALKFSWD